MFQLQQNKKDSSMEKKVKWKFVNHDQVFESRNRQLKINHNFWMQKITLDDYAIQVKYGHLINIKQIQP